MRNFLKFITKLPSDIKNKTSRSIEHLLSHRVEDCITLTGIAVRRFISPALRKSYRKHVPYEIIKDTAVPLEKSNKGRIYAVTHRQKEDIIISMIAADDSAYVVFGGTDIALDTMNGLGLWSYGIILIDRKDADSRKAAYNKMKYAIEHGANVTIFPEGYFNIADDGEADTVHGADGHHSDSWLVQDLSLGAFKLAQETGCEIVPVVLHYDETKGNNCYYHRGRPFKVTPNDDVLKVKDQVLTVMHTEYYSLIEKYSTYKREDLEADGVSLKMKNKAHIANLLKVCEIEHTGYKMDMAEEKLIGKAKNKKHIVTKKEAFAHLEKVVLSENSKFLYREKI